MNPAPSLAGERDRLLALAFDELTRACRVVHCRGQGPGGQSRNTTESAVTVTHVASGIHGYADDSRSQIRNRELALGRLRLQLALTWRQAAPGTWNLPSEPPGAKSLLYPTWVAALFDVLQEKEWRIADAARFCGLSTGRLIRLLARDAALWQTVNRQRQAANLPGLRHP